jgi:uncharacterized GH25 family protein
MNRYWLVFALLALSLAPFAPAHDTWVQPNTNAVRTGDAIHLDLMLGNHGNDHRDFKLASKLSPELIQTFEVIDPKGKKVDLKPRMHDLGYAPKEGYHSARFIPADSGLYTVAQTLDKVMAKGTPIRAYRSAKSYFVAGESLDKLPLEKEAFKKPIGHRMELVPQMNPVASVGVGQPIKVKLLFDGKPLAGVKISFIPRGTVLKEGTDPDYERTTDKEGLASFTPKIGTYHLIVAHYPIDEKGEGYERAHYAATLTLLIPEKCPCCAD